MRLIDADKLTEEWLKEILDEFKNTPEYKRHSDAHWISATDNSCPMAECSECGCRMILNVYNPKIPYRYCPYCGAKMHSTKDMPIWKEDEPDE